MNDQWKNNLRDRMGDHEEPAPEGLWEGIERRVSTGRAVKGMAGSKKQALWGARIAAVAAVAIILLLIARDTSMENQTGTGLTEGRAPVAIRPEYSYGESAITESPRLPGSSGNVIVKPAPEKELQIGGTEILVASRQVKEFSGNMSSPGERSDPEEKGSAGAMDVSSKKYDPDAGRDPDEEAGVGEEADSSQSVDNGPLFALSSRKGDSPDPPGRDRKHAKWQTNLGMSNIPSGSTEKYSGYGTLLFEEIVDAQYAFRSDYTKQKVHTDVQHNQPVTVALTARYNLNEKWGVTSGLTYSILSSRLRSGNNNYYYDDRQTLHYVGVPLNIAYTFWQNNTISTYISSGGLVEKNVAGRLSSNYYLENKLELSTREKISTKYLQWSVNTSIGLEYRFSNLIGLYVEPGIAYYFKDGSELETIYKDRPLNFNLRLGLRFSLGD